MPTPSLGMPTAATSVSVSPASSSSRTLRHVDAERVARRRHRLAHHRVEVLALQREAPELGDGVLLARAPRELLRGLACAR